MVKTRVSGSALLALSVAVLLSSCAPDSPAGNQARGQSPEPPSPLETLETSIFVLTLDGEGKLAPASGSPYLIEMFLPGGGSGGGLAADFRNTRFDLKAVHDQSQRAKVGLAVQKGEGRDFAATIVVDAREYSWFYVDSNRRVFPPWLSEVQAGGPFLTLVFHDDDYDPLPSSWMARVRYDEAERGSEEHRLRAEGQLQVAAVGQAPIQWFLKSPNGEAEYSGVVYPRFVGAAPGLVLYKIWSANSETYKVAPR